MAQITDIKQQVKQAGRYSVYVDGAFCFGISANGLLESGLHTGQEITLDQLKQLRSRAAEDKSYNLLLNLIARRQRSRYEIEQYMQRKKYDKNTAEQLITKLEQAGHIEDEAFAKAWVSNRRLLKSISRRRLVQELRAKGIATTTIEAVMANDNTEDSEVLTDLVRRKSQQSRYKDPQKLLAYLVRQGYGYADVKQALDGYTRP